MTHRACLRNATSLALAVLLGACFEDVDDDSAGSTETSSTTSTSSSTSSSATSASSGSTSSSATGTTTDGSGTTTGGQTGTTDGTSGSSGSTTGDSSTGGSSTGGSSTGGTTDGNLCGNGTIDPGEECDDGNDDPTDTCFPNCVEAPLLVWYPFDGDNVNYGIEPGHDAQSLGAPSFTTGKVGMAAKCPTNGDTILVPGLRDLLLANPSFTIAMWVREDPALAGVSLFDIRPDNVNGTGFQTYHGNDPGVFNTCAWGSGGFLECKPAPATEGAWHQIVWRYAGTGQGAGEGAVLDVFVDGKLLATIANPAKDPIVTDTSEADGVLCGFWGNATDANFEIDEVKVWGAVWGTALQCEIVLGGTWENNDCTLP